jgi:SAM-dependent methyltransferase
VTVAPEVMFRNYLYVSGVADSFRVHCAEYAREVTERFLSDDPFVVEIGSNDGTLLKAFDRQRVRVLGVEPARNIAALANAQGVETLDQFFGAEVGRTVASQYGRADAIIGNNVVAHIDDLHGLVAAIDALLSDDGVFIAEFPYIADFIERVEYDTIYHEHLSYFSVRAASTLFRKFDLELFDARRTAIHGGSIRIFVGRGRPKSAELEALLAKEQVLGFDRMKPFHLFAERAERQRMDLRELLGRLAREGRRIAAYGAAAKGNTLLNYCGLDADLIAFVGDRSPLKHGLYTPGTHIPIRDSAAIEQEMPDYTLLLAWNFEAEILRQQNAYRARGGRFIVPIPLPRVV